MLKLQLFAGVVLLATVGVVCGQVAPAAPPVIIGGLPAGATYPQVVSTTPKNNSDNVSTNLRQISITFDQPMNTTTFAWTLPAGANLPTVTGRYNWTNANKTIEIPVSVQLGVTYQIPLNVTDQAFKSAQGIPLPAGYLTFTVSNSTAKITKPFVTPPSSGTRTGTTSRGGIVPITGGSVVQPSSSSNNTVSLPATNKSTQNVNQQAVTPTPNPNSKMLQGNIRQRLQSARNTPRPAQATSTPTPH